MEGWFRSRAAGGRAVTPGARFLGPTTIGFRVDAASAGTVTSVERRHPPLLWLLYALIFTLDAVPLAALDAPRPLVVLCAVTGLASVVTFFMATRPQRQR